MKINNDREYLDALERNEINSNYIATIVGEIKGVNPKFDFFATLDEAYAQLREDISNIEEYQKSFSSDNEWIWGIRMDPLESHRGVPALEEEVRSVLSVLSTLDNVTTEEKIFIQYKTEKLLESAKGGSLSSNVNRVRSICNRFELRDIRKRPEVVVSNAILPKEIILDFPKEIALYLSKLRYLLIAINTLSKSSGASANPDSDNNVIDMRVHYHL